MAFWTFLLGLGCERATMMMLSEVKASCSFECVHMKWNKSDLTYGQVCILDSPVWTLLCSPACLSPCSSSWMLISPSTPCCRPARVLSSGLSFLWGNEQNIKPPEINSQTCCMINKVCCSQDNLLRACCIYLLGDGDLAFFLTDLDRDLLLLLCPLF